MSACMVELAACKWLKIAAAQDALSSPNYFHDHAASHSTAVHPQQ